jgi:putative phage-type endonuclease
MFVDIDVVDITKLYIQVLLERCSHVSTIGMSNDAWLDKRREGIGGSDAGAILGMSAYGSPLTVYLQKKNLVPKGETSKAAHRGKILEPMIRAETARDFPELEIEPLPAVLTDPEHPFMSANIDGVIFAKAPVEIRGQAVEGLGGHEIKSAKTGFGWGEDEIPDAYYAQVQHYMKVTGLPWFVVSVYILDDESLCHYAIRRNDEFVARLVAAETDFWKNYVEADAMPAPLGIDNEDDMITGMFEGANQTIILGERERGLCAEYVLIRDQIKELENRKGVIAITLKEAIVNNAEKNPGELKAQARAGVYSISWSRFKRHDVDSDALKRDGLYEKYAKVSESGRFTITEKKGA